MASEQRPGLQAARGSTGSRLLMVSLVAALLIWVAFAFRERGTLPLPKTGEPAAKTVAPIAAPQRPSPSSPTSDRPNQTPAANQNTAPLHPPPVALTTGPLAWEQQIAEATARGRDTAGQARGLFALLPRLPEEARAVTAQQAVEHLPDAEYAALALPVVTDPATHGQVMSVLFADLMERPDAIALPALLAIARQPAHPYAATALDNLRLLLGATYGNDWRKWNEAIQDAVAPK